MARLWGTPDSIVQYVVVMEANLRQYIQSVAVAVSMLFLVSGAVLLGNSEAHSEILDTSAALEERSLGDSNAPLTIYEYSSLGCPHCKAFHKNTLPMVMEEFIDTGKVRLVYRDYPLGNRAMAAAMIARCAPQERYFGMLELFFQKQSDWSQSEDAIGALTAVAKFGGLSSDDVMACLQDQDLLNGIRTRAEAGSDEFGIEATPTFIIGDTGEKIEGAMGPDEFRKVLNDALN